MSNVVLALAAFLLVTAGAAWAQTGMGNIQGTIMDASGAIIQSAQVTLVHTATARRYTTETNGVGFFLFPPVQPGTYEISNEAPGMKNWTAQLNLVVGQVAELNPVLEVGATDTQVTVAGDVTPLVTTTSPTLATALERQRIDQLPLNGRNFTSLLYMTVPGATNSPPGRGVPPAVFGALYGTEILQDSAVLENRHYGQVPDRLPGLDTVAELRAETSNSSAKYNRVGTVIVSTRSGTNDVHGSVFETGRNSGFRVARSRTDFYNKSPHLVRNEFGASLGGPAFVLKVYNGKNKTFFFFAYEGYKLRQASTRATSLPTAAMRSGDCSGLVNSIGQKYTLYDPLTTQSAAANWARTPFSNNQIPVGRMSPLAKYLYSQTPLPTTADNPLATQNWYGLGFQNTDQYTTTVRIDHRISEKNNLFFRYSHNPSMISQTSSTFDGAPTLLDGSGNAISSVGRNDNGVANWTHSFSPTFFSETQVTVSRDYHGGLPLGAGNTDVASKLGLPNPFKGIGMPRIRYSNMPGTPLPGGDGVISMRGSANSPGCCSLRLDSAFKSRRLATGTGLIIFTRPVPEVRHKTSWSIQL